MSGDIRDSINHMIVKDINEKFTKPCEKYFCHYCLKGSYQVNIDSNEVENKDKEKDKEKEKESINLDKKESSKSKNFKVIKCSKDWCCPYCTNDCFCSRCTREEQIFKLLGIYFYYNGNMTELFNNVIKNPLLQKLKNDLILSYLEIKDYSFSERTCKKKVDEESNVVTTNINSKNIKRIRSRSMKKIRVSSNAATSKNLIKNSKVDNNNDEAQIKGIENEIKNLKDISTLLEKQRNKLCESLEPLFEFKEIILKEETNNNRKKTSEAEFKLGKIKNFKKYNKEKLISYVESNSNRVKESSLITRERLRGNRDNSLELTENNKNNKLSKSKSKKKDKKIKFNQERIRYSRHLRSRRMLGNKRSN